MHTNTILLKTNLCSMFSRYDQIIVFDVETTGLDKFDDEVIEITMVELEGDCERTKIKEVEDLYINLQGRELPELIVNLTGITDAFLNENGHPRALVAKKTMNKLLSKRTLLIAHNANFDMNFLLAMLQKEKCGINMDDIDVIDTLTIYKDRHPYPHKLSDAISTYGLAEYAENSHRSKDDAIATLFVFDAMCMERDDVEKYINLIGINPKYGLSPRDRIRTIRYHEQPYNCINKLYESKEISTGGVNEPHKKV